MSGGLRERIFLGKSQRDLMGQGTPVLAYHYLGTPPKGTPDPYLYVSAYQLRQQFEQLKAHGYTTTTTLSSLANARADSHAPRKQVVITIDDGARNFFELGMNILDEFGFRAIQFIVSGQIGGINEWDSSNGHPVVPLMDEGQIREWLAAGHEIGSHSVSHRNLAKLGNAETTQQVADSRKSLEDRFGSPVRHFCYPHGKFTSATVEAVREAGYETACTTRFGVNGPAENPYQLQRIQPLSFWQLAGKMAHRLSTKLPLVR